MTEFSEDPFPMDEELDVYEDIPVKTLPIYSELKHILLQEFDKTILHQFDNMKMDSELDSATDQQYTEDVDDKFDAKVHEALNLEFTKHHTSLTREPLTPPENFAPVINNIYRSSFPQAVNFEFLKRLKLKSILCLIPEEYPELHQQFLKQHQIKLFQMGMSGNKEPFVIISHDLITEALKVVLDPANQPILIHCNRGKHRTGCLVGILRRLQNWSLTIIFDEYRKFAAPKERPMDQQYIELYDETDIMKFATQNQLIPLSWDLALNTDRQ